MIFFSLLDGAIALSFWLVNEVMTVFISNVASVRKYKKWVRGMTLIEVTIMCVVMGVLLMAAAPSFRGLHEKYKMRHLADEMMNVFLMAKMEAVMTNHATWLYFVPKSNSPIYKGDWVFSVQKDDVLIDYASAKNDAIYFLDGNQHKNISISSIRNFQKIKFDRINGKPVGVAGGLTFYIDATRGLNVIFHNITGRIRICGINIANHGNEEHYYYGYPEC